MLYRPHFCCHCGEKIIRAKWTPLTSRRFCEFCAVEQKQHDLLPRVAAIALLIFGAAGFTAYIGSGSKPGPGSAGDTPARALEPKGGQPRTTTNNQASSTTPGDAKGAAPPASPQASSNADPANIKQRPIVSGSSTETVYYCGAITKKGTPCTRRVKAPGRCWQHAGQLAATSQEN